MQFYGHEYGCTLSACFVPHSQGLTDIASRNVERRLWQHKYVTRGLKYVSLSLQKKSSSISSYTAKGSHQNLKTVDIWKLSRLNYPHSPLPLFLKRIIFNIFFLDYNGFPDKNLEREKN